MARSACDGHQNNGALLSDAPSGWTTSSRQAKIHCHCGHEINPESMGLRARVAHTVGQAHGATPVCWLGAAGFMHGC